MNLKSNSKSNINLNLNPYLLYLQCLLYLLYFKNTWLVSRWDHFDIEAERKYVIQFRKHSEDHGRPQRETTSIPNV